MFKARHDRDSLRILVDHVDNIRVLSVSEGDSIQQHVLDGDGIGEARVSDLDANFKVSVECRCHVVSSHLEDNIVDNLVRLVLAFSVQAESR